MSRQVSTLATSQKQNLLHIGRALSQYYGMIEPDFTGNNMKSFDQNHELWRASSPSVIMKLIVI